MREIFYGAQSRTIEQDAQTPLLFSRRGIWAFYGSNGSTLITAAPRLLPTQKVGGLVELSTFTRRTLVIRGSRYSVTSPVLVFTRTTRSFDIPPVHALPSLSRTAS